MIDQRTKQAVTVIGLGAMGSTLARAMLSQEQDVIVWNRSPERAKASVEAGAHLATSLADAVKASRLIIVCTIDKSVALDLLREPTIATLLDGKTIVNFSTGSADEARSTAAHVEAHGGSYIDGGIMAYPRDIGKGDTLMLYGGNAAAFGTHRHTLAALGGCIRFLSEDAGTVPYVYLALYGYYFGCVTSFFEGAALAEKAGISPGLFLDATKSLQSMLDTALNDSTERLTSGSVSGEQASINVHHAGQLIVRDAFVDEGLPSLITDAYIRYLERAQQLGDGENDIATLYLAIKKGLSNIAIGPESKER